MVRDFAAALLALLALGGAAHAQATPNDIGELLAAHNAYRTPLGLAPLQWSDALQARAQIWADHLAATGTFEHNGSGQNLAMAADGTESLTQLVDLWGAEQANFTDGVFPDVSATGNWMDVGHYSQIIWKDTASVGCGMAANEGRDVLVCDYDPPGNVMGERPY